MTYAGLIHRYTGARSELCHHGSDLPMTALRLMLLSAGLAMATAGVAAQKLQPPTLQPFASGHGGADGDSLGLSLRAVGDVDKDGTEDFIVGAPRDDGNVVDSGSASVYSGRTRELLYLFRGASAHDAFGYSVAGAGDVDLDGFADVIVGAPNEENRVDAHVHARAGSAQVFSGRDGDLLHTFHGPREGAALGWSVGSAGDIDRDGHDDLLVGAPFYERKGAAGAGMVLVYSGRTGEVIHMLVGERAGDRFGWAVCGIGDVDRDRSPDFVVGIEGSTERLRQAGAAQIFSGRKGKLIHTLRTGQDEDYFGTAVANASDIDGDKRDDVIIGGWNGSNEGGEQAGIAVVFSSRTGKEILRLAGAREHDRFGTSVAGVGDLDGDGRPDLAVGAPQDPRIDQGYLQLFSSATGAALATFRGKHIGDAFGTSVSGVGDRNDDGVPDILIGIPGRRQRGGWILVPGPARADPGKE